MIQFQCGHCGVKLKVPEAQAGKSGRCPKCRTTIRVPLAPPLPPAPLTETASPLPYPVAASSIDERLFDVPQPRPTAEQEPRENRAEAETQTRLDAATAREEVGERQSFWLVDVLLYPANIAGLTTLIIVAGIPLFLSFMMYVGGPLAIVAGLPAFIIDVLIRLYAVWYYAECVYDSAKGGTRAPMALDTAGDLRETFSRVLHLTVVYILFVFPAAVYWVWVRQTDTIFWGLIAWAIVFFPMGLLAMVIQDSTSALNPFSLLLAILRTFIPYLLLLLSIAAVVGLYLLVHTLFMSDAYSSWFLGGMGAFAMVYLQLVLAHVLGRFYWRHREQLDWGL